MSVCSFQFGRLRILYSIYIQEIYILIGRWLRSGGDVKMGANIAANIINLN